MQSSVIRKANVQFQLDLHPSRLENVQRGVADELSRHIMRYNEDLDGVVLSISEPTVLSHKARIHPYFPYFSLKVTASVVVFNPKPGDFLVGQVNQTGADYIALLVLGVFSASIGVQNMRSEFKRDEQAGCWQSSKRDSHKITVDTLVRFQVASVRDQGGFFSIVGSLQDPSTGEVHHAHKAMVKQQRKAKKSSKGQDGAQQKTQKAKKRSRSESNGDLADPSKIAAQVMTPNIRKKKKSKGAHHEPGQPSNGVSHPTPQSISAGVQPSAAAAAAPGEMSQGTSAKKRKRRHAVEAKLSSEAKPPATPSMPEAGGPGTTPEGVSGKKKAKSKSKSMPYTQSDATVAGIAAGVVAPKVQSGLDATVHTHKFKSENAATPFKAHDAQQDNGEAVVKSESKAKQPKGRSKDSHVAAQTHLETDGASGGLTSVNHPGKEIQNTSSERKKNKKKKV